MPARIGIPYFTRSRAGDSRKSNNKTFVILETSGGWMRSYIVAGPSYIRAKEKTDLK